ncbi:MAG TPA: FecR domain-containing protein [Pedobacter sp.]|nr:FecR domain-containing protein [Pedobacter sp.]
MKHAQKTYFLEILKKYKEEKASIEEIKFLEAYYNAFEANDDLINEENEAGYVYLRDSIKTAVDKKISAGSSVKKLNNNWFRYSAAAAVLLLLSVAVYFVKRDKKQDFIANIDQQISPGGNKAVLTLGSGQQIILNDAATGEIAKQSGISITKTADGQIVYTIKDLSASSDNGEVLKNTITTPKGGQYKIVLPDGTNVFLNAASSLVYPASFQGAERLVTLNGEAYFEVAKKMNMPFIVKSGQQTVEVLGTHFNINAYDDENVIRTTLTEGSVKVSSATASSMISPGQQAVLSKNGNGAIIKRNVSTEKETAWKNGLFSFEGDDIKSVMRSISRWYNVEVSYRGDLSDIEFTGEIFRTAKLSEVYKILELNNIHFDVEGKKIIVSYDQEAIKTNQP